MSKKFNWMLHIGGIMSVASVKPLIQALASSNFSIDAGKFAEQLKARGITPMHRRILYQAVMHVSSGCPFNVPRTITLESGKKFIINETHYLTYSQTLQALMTQSPRHFNGNLIGIHDKAAIEQAMQHKWELFRAGYFVCRDTEVRSGFSMKFEGADHGGSKNYKTVCEVAHKDYIRKLNENEQGIIVT